MSSVSVCPSVCRISQKVTDRFCHDATMLSSVQVANCQRGGGGLANRSIENSTNASNVTVTAAKFSTITRQCQVDDFRGQVQRESSRPQTPYTLEHHSIYGHKTLCRHDQSEATINLTVRLRLPTKAQEVVEHQSFPHICSNSLTMISDVISETRRPRAKNHVRPSWTVNTSVPARVAVVSPDDCTRPVSLTVVELWSAVISARSLAPASVRRVVDLVRTDVITVVVRETVDVLVTHAVNPASGPVGTIAVPDCVTSRATDLDAISRVPNVCRVVTSVSESAENLVLPSVESVIVTR